MDIIICVMMVIFAVVPTHNKFFFSSFKTYGSNWFCTIARNINISHILVWTSSLLNRNISTTRVTKLTSGLNVRQKIMLLVSWIIKVHILSCLIVTSMSWWFTLWSTDIRWLIFSKLLHLLLLFISIPIIVIRIILQILFWSIMT